MRILITGVGGFLGQTLAAYARERGHELAGIDRAPIQSDVALKLRVHAQSAVTAGELDELLQRFRPEVCVHLAGRASVPLSVTDPVGDFEAATLPTLALLDGVRRQVPACRVVFASSAAVYGAPEVLPISEVHPRRPVSPYGFHKRMCEDLCREFAQLYGLESAVVRIFSAYGEGLRRQVVWDICEKTAHEGPLVLQGVPHASRDFVHARDVAAGILCVAERGRMQGDSYNLASGIETTIEDLAHRVCRALGVERDVVFDGSVPKGTPVRWQADVGRLRALGFAPSVDFDEGIQQFCAWWRLERVRSARPQG